VVASGSRAETSARAQVASSTGVGRGRDARLRVLLGTLAVLAAGAGYEPLLQAQWRPRHAVGSRFRQLVAPYPSIPGRILDNNQSESALRVVAQGRKAFLFVGHEEAGDNLAALYTLVRTCEAVGVNPLDYLADVLIRIQTHPADRIDDLLPHRWAPPVA